MKAMPGRQKDKYDTVELIDGFVAWNKYLAETDKNVPMNKLWVAWTLRLKNTGKIDDHSLFIEFFECIQIRSMSEAMAETVGSLMNINSGTGRQLQPVNFSVEIYLRFNLGPLHTLGGLVKDVVDKHNKKFFRKGLPRGMKTYTTGISSAIFTYRKKAETNCHIPFKINK